MHSPDIGSKFGRSSALVFGQQAGGAYAAAGAGSSSARAAASSSSQDSAPAKSQQQQQSARQQHGRNSLQIDDAAVNNVVTIVCFATALMENLARINRGKCAPFVRGRSSASFTNSGRAFDLREPQPGAASYVGPAGSAAVCERPRYILCASFGR